MRYLLPSKEQSPYFYPQILRRRRYWKLAERQGFEPWVQLLTVQRFCNLVDLSGRWKGGVSTPPLQQASPGTAFRP